MRWLVFPILAAVFAIGAAVAIARPGHRGGGIQPAPQVATKPPATATTSPPALFGPLPPEAAGVLQAPASLPAAPARSGGCGAALERGDFVKALPTSDGDRSYRLHLPASYLPTAPMPLVLNFHGSSQTALAQETYSQLVPLAEREHFILVTPEGSGSPPGWDIPGVYHNQGYDDVDFTLQLVDDVKRNLCVDMDRVYATGLSNGAEMASLLGCRHPEVFAAIAPVAGVIYDVCTAPGVPVISLHGTFDQNIPFDGIPATMSRWAAHNGCDSGGQVEQYTEAVSRITYGDCGGRDVVLFVVNGGGHTWPGAEDGAGGAGPTTHEISANGLIWAFFAAHPRLPGAVTVPNTP